MSNTTVVAMVCLFFMSLVSCQSNEKAADDESQIAQVGSFPLPMFTRLMQECDYVDIIFFDSPASISQNDQRSIQSALMFMDPVAAQLDPTCKPLGRISYMIDGEIVAEGDFYCDDRCQYIAFVEEGKVVYANTLSGDGVSFFTNIIKQIERTQQ